MNAPQPDLCWWCYSHGRILPQPGEHVGGYGYLCERCRARRPRHLVPTDALAEDLIEHMTSELDTLCLTSEQRRAVVVRIAERLAIGPDLRVAQ